MSQVNDCTFSLSSKKESNASEVDCGFSMKNSFVTESPEASEAPEAAAGTLPEIFADENSDESQGEDTGKRRGRPRKTQV